MPIYDDNGNMTSDGSYGSRTYAYDTLGRLTAVTADGTTTTYALDGAGNRWSQSTAGVTTSFDLDLAAGNATILSDGSRTYLPGAPGAGYDQGGTWFSALTDLVGSPIEYVSQAGTTTSPVHFDPYGTVRPGAAASVGIGYAGEYRDATGLINLRARSYDPMVARFVGRDTFGGVMSAPQTGNCYAYAVANPMRYTDPSGHFINKIVLNPTAWLVALSFVNPWIGIVYSGFVGITGYDPLTGQQVSGGVQALNSLVAFAGVFGKVAGIFADAWAETELGGGLGMLGRADGGWRTSEEPGASSGPSRLAVVTSARSAETLESLGKPREPRKTRAAVSLFHYTNEEGQAGILNSQRLNPSLKSINPSDARYGDGQYLSDIKPGTYSNASLSSRFIRNPYQGARFSHYVEVDVTGLAVIEGRFGVFVIPNEEPMDLLGRIISSGRN